ncbi:MAG: hypothetical protein QM589_12850 [Thermomicrobiales bacterium]
MSAARRSTTSDDHRDDLATPAPEPSGSGKPRRTRATATTKRRRTAASEAAQEVTGIVGDASASVSRSGEDVRKRGWYWHWNSIVTQYAPLLGMKGVGLLNSYTVWTDRREESPHRGYAFPSQQSEADFYGEDRAELITINKILVALDLIEIRKEMVLRVDAQGRRWKVPHNLYRVKDHGDDVTLTTQDVMRVIELADRDRAVYRYLRRVFSTRFSPIDHANVWHQILEEVRPTPVWQRLAARAEKEDRKASERTKAGHAARKGNVDPAQDDVTGSAVSEAGKGVFSLPNNGDNATSKATGVASNTSTNNDSGTDEDIVADRPAATIVASANKGSHTQSDTVDEPGNNGWPQNYASTVGDGNTGRQTTVAPSNTTYHQSKTTTTGIDARDEMMVGRRERPEITDRFGTRQAPDTSRDESIAIQRFAEANDRQPTMAERRHLRQLAEFASPIVEQDDGAAWYLVVSAIEEAVSAGSSFVAPKRIREILARWSRDGVPVEYAGAVPEASVVDGESMRRSRGVAGVSGGGHRGLLVGSAAESVDGGPVLPNGRKARAVWTNACREIAGALGEAAAEGLLAGTAIAAYDTGAVTIRVRDEEQGAALLGEHAPLLERALRSQLRRPVRLATVLAGTADDAMSSAPAGCSPESRVRRDGPSRPEPVTLGVIPVFMIDRCGLTNRQLWSMVLHDLRERGAIPAADIDAWLRDAALLAADDSDGMVTFLLGVPHVLAQRRVEARFRSAIAGALATLLGDEALDVGIDVTLLREWHARESA